MYIQELSVKNFKSLKNISLKFNKINVFIGDTNTGKSNLIELIAFLGSLGNFMEDKYEENFGSYLHKHIRYKSWFDIFYDRNIEEQIEINLKYSIEENEKNLTLKIIEDEGGLVLIDATEDIKIVDIDYSGVMTPYETDILKDLKVIKFYNFGKYYNLEEISATMRNFSLACPDGKNLFQTIWSSKERREFFRHLLLLFGYQVVFDIAEKKITFLKQQDDLIVNFPLELLSDTLKATVFYYMALLSNENAVICFDEPETFMYPSHVLDLAEDIAGSPEHKNNQIILTTHNSYFIDQLLSKSDSKDINLFISRFNNFQSEFKLLSQKEVEKAFEMDILMNYEMFFEGS